MQPRQRVLTALHHQVPDRVPFFVRFTPPVLAELQRRTGAADPASYFDTDVRDVVIDPSAIQRDYSPYLVDRPPNIYVDDQGIGRTRGTFHHYTHIVPLLDRATRVAEIESYPLNDTDGPYRYETYKERVRSMQAAGYAVRGRVGSIFEWAWQVRGFENLLVDAVEQPDLAECLLDRRTAVLCRAARLQVAAGIDVLGVHDDVAMQTGPMMSAAMYRRWLKPRLASVIAAAREVRRDILIWYHSDGNITPLIPDLIEAGVDILHPVQPECVDGPAVKRQFGDRLAFWGGMGIQTTMPFGTADDVRREVRRLQDTLGEGGGLLLEPTHVVQPDVPWENVLAYVEACRAAAY